MTIPEYRAETASALTRVLYDGRFDEVHSHWRELFTAQAVAAEEQSHDTRVQRAYAQLRAANRSLTDPRGLANDPHRLAAMHEWAATVDQSLATVAGIHYNLFLGSLLDADPHPARELAPFLTMERTGTFLVTELGHGNSAARLETTATYHAEDGTFTLHTPVPAARKFMPNTSLLGGAKSAVVAARLLVAGEDRGVFGFLVPLHDGQALLPGVHIRRLPAKAGSPVDHCLTWFDGVTLPRHALLEGEHGRLDADGILNSRYDRTGRRFLHSIGRVTTGKLCMTGASLGGARVALTLALRYAHIRRTSNVAGRDSVPLFAHRPHQARLLDALVTVYAATLLHRRALNRWVDGADDPDGPAERFVALAKGWITWQMREVLFESRERCGAQGMFAFNGIADYVLANEGAITAEGDNLAIWVKAAGELLLEHTEAERGEPVPAEDLESPEYLQYLMERGEHFWLRRAREAAFAEGVGEDTASRWNSASSHALRAAQALSERLAAEALYEAALKCLDPQAGALLSLMHRAFALSRLAPVSGQLLAEGHLSAETISTLLDRYDEALAELAGHSLTLTDAFAVPESFLATRPLAQPDFDTVIDRFAEQLADATAHGSTVPAG